MWRAVRAGIILRAQRADAPTLRPLKLDVRSREFQNDFRKKRERCLRLRLPAYLLRSAPACAANSFDLRPPADGSAPLRVTVSVHSAPRRAPDADSVTIGFLAPRSAAV